MLAVAKADRVDAHKQPSLRTEGGRTAVVTLGKPVGGDFYGSIPKTRRFGAAAPALHYNWSLGIAAPLARRVSAFPGTWGILVNLES